VFLFDGPAVIELHKNSPVDWPLSNVFSGLSTTP
jgi:hypothetical protein